MGSFSFGSYSEKTEKRRKMRCFRRRGEKRRVRKNACLKNSSLGFLKISLPAKGFVLFSWRKPWHDGLRQKKEEKETEENEK